MPNRMNRDEFYAAMARHDDAYLRKILWTVYWRGNAQLRERIEDELRPQDQPKVKPKKELPDPASVLDEVTTFVELAKDGAYMAGDRRVHHTERSRWRHTFRRLAADALAALAASGPAPAQQAVAKIVDLACDMKRYDYFHSDDPVEAAKFVVSEAVTALWESVLRHDGFAAFAGRAPEQLIRWESEYGWTRRGYGQVAERETLLAVPLARLLTTPDMWRTFAESYLESLEVAGRADPSGRAASTEPSMRPVTGARSGRTISPRGMRCSSSGSRAHPRTNCLTDSSSALHSPGRNSTSCTRGSQSAAVTFPWPPRSSPATGTPPPSATCSAASSAASTTA
jgi:hypothetical protein